MIIEKERRTNTMKMNSHFSSGSSTTTRTLSRRKRLFFSLQMLQLIFFTISVSSFSHPIRSKIQTRAKAAFPIGKIAVGTLPVSLSLLLSSLSSHRSTTTAIHAFNYGRGADIWPECNEDPVQLQDSFPNGNIPYSAILSVDATDMQEVHTAYEESTLQHDPEVVENSNVAAPPSTLTTTRQPSSSSASSSVEKTTTTTSTTTSSLAPGLYQERRRGRVRFLVSKSVRRLLRRAAAREEVDSEQEMTIGGSGGGGGNGSRFSSSMTGDRRIPAVVLAAGLVLNGLVRPMDILVVASLTTYYTLLTMVARSPRDNGLAPIMPATPPQGHVPTMVTNPLGIGTLYSRTYDRWLQTGVGLGLILPLSYIISATLIQMGGNAASVRACARPLFLLCCQAITEIYSKRMMAPLPIRILIPISYNIARLGYLWHWMMISMMMPFSSESMTTATTTTMKMMMIKMMTWMGRSLAVSNLVYGFLNLFAFLIPVAVPRYMRSYFFGVEASEVTTRIGMEETIGLVSTKQ